MFWVSRPGLESIEQKAKGKGKKAPFRVPRLVSWVKKTGCVGVFSYLF